MILPRTDDFTIQSLMILPDNPSKIYQQIPNDFTTQGLKTPD
jgi:hypothetical protein